MARTAATVALVCALASSVARAQPPSADPPPEAGEEGAALEGGEEAPAAEAVTAEDAATEPPIDPEQPELRAILADAVAEYDAARFREAQALFRRAQRLSPSGRTLRGIGMASFEVGEYVVALRALREALVETRRPLTEEQRAHVQGLIERTLGYVARVRLDVEPATAVVRIDGSDVEGEPDGTVLLDAGAHSVTATAEGRSPRSITIEAEGGAEQRVTLVLEEREPASTPTRDALLAIGIGAVSLGVLAGGASIVTGVVALSAEDELAASCSGFVCPGEELDTQSDAQALATATDVLWVSAAILGAAGIGLILAGLLYEEAPVQPSAACSTHGCFAVVEGTF